MLRVLLSCDPGRWNYDLVVTEGLTPHPSESPNSIMKFILVLTLLSITAGLVQAQKMRPSGLTEAEKIYNKGTDLQAADDLDGAVAAYTRAIELDPDYADAYDNRGFIKMNRGDLVGAIADFGQAIRLRPDKFEGYMNRGTAYLMHEEFSAAITDLDQALAISPKYPTAYHNRGNAYHGLGKTAEAIADFTRAIEIYPAPAFYYSRGAELSIAGKPTEALADYAKAIEINPEYARAYANRGVIFWELDKPADADREFEQAFKLDPNLHAEFDQYIKDMRAAHSPAKRRK